MIDFSRISLRHVQDVDDDVLKKFSCGRDQLDDFLCCDAKNYSRHGLTSTVVVFFVDQIIPIAYFSLTADAVRLSGSEKNDLCVPFDVPISFYPAVKITKLAVATNYQRHGVGEKIISLILGIVSNAPFAVRLLTVDSVNKPEIIGFYQRAGFVESLSDANEKKQQRHKETVLMFRDIYNS
jgi:GNAT superfamily N-acetyltransferase